MRRFECPFCAYVHIFPPKKASRWKKRVLGFTCPCCGKKPTEDDFNEKKGMGPKPPGERRKRLKKVEASIPRNIKLLKELPEIDITPIEWRTRDLEYTSPWEVSHPASRAGGRGYKPSQPLDITLEEAILVSRKIKISAPIPRERRR